MGKYMDFVQKLANNQKAQEEEIQKLRAKNQEVAQLREKLAKLKTSTSSGSRLEEKDTKVSTNLQMARISVQGRVTELETEVKDYQTGNDSLRKKVSCSSSWVKRNQSLLRPKHVPMILEERWWACPISSIMRRSKRPPWRWFSSTTGR